MERIANSPRPISRGRASLCLSLSLRSRENRGGFEGANGCLAWAEKLGTRRSRGQQLIAVGRESGRMENETWAEGMVEKWPIFQIWRGRGCFAEVCFSLEKRKIGARNCAWRHVERHDEKGCVRFRRWLFANMDNHVRDAYFGGGGGDWPQQREWSSLYHLTERGGYSAIHSG